MGNTVVNQCEYGCGIIGHFDLEYQKQVGEELEEHYKNCPLQKISEAFDVMDDNMPECESSNCLDINKESWSNFHNEINKLVLKEINKATQSGVKR